MDIDKIKKENKELNIKEIKENRLILKSRPTKFWFNLTGACNLQCAHCLSNVTGRKSTNEVDQIIYEKVIKDLLPYAENCLLGGTNYGEMLISKNISNFLEECKKNFVKVNLTTNGVTVKDDIIPKLVEVCNVIGFSMEGMEEEYEKIRHYKWENFISNVKRIISAKEKYGQKELRLEFRFAVHCENIKQLPKLIEFSKEIGINRIQVMLLRGDVKSQKFKTLYYHRSLANEYFEKAEEKAKELNFDISLPGKFSTGTFEKAKKYKPEINTKPCYNPWNTVSIDELGNVTPCCAHYEIVGNLKEQPFYDIWNSELFQNLRKTVNTDPDECCFYCKNRILF